LDRNICFVDTPGYSSGPSVSSSVSHISPLVEHGLLLAGC
jgi:hypothetical protein